MREYHYRVDGDGRVFHDGSEIVDAPTLRFFLLGMRRQPDGRWLVPCQGEQNWFAAEDTPFVVQRLRLDVGATAGCARVGSPRRRAAGSARSRRARDRSRPPLLPACAAAPSARASGALAMQQLAPYLEESAGRVTLLMAGARHAIARRARR